MGSKYTVYLEIKNDTLHDIVDITSKTSDSKSIRLKDKLSNRTIKSKGGALRESYKVCVKSRIPKSYTPMYAKMKERYQLEMILRYSDESEDAIELQQLAVLPGASFAELKGHRILKGYHKLIIIRDRSKKGFKIHATHTDFHAQDREAQDIILEAQGDMEKTDYESAIEKYENAFKKGRDDSTLTDARFGQAKAYGHMGEALVREAFELEGDSTRDKSSEAQKLLDGARNRFRRAKELFECYETENKLQMSTLLIKGNELFNKASDFEDQAFDVLERTRNVGVVQKLLQGALIEYEAAEKIFEQGLRNHRQLFLDRLSTVRKQIEAVDQVLTNISPD